jgi:PTS system mannose-specific IID component
MENMKTNQETITSQDINSVSKRWILASQITWNYEKMMAIGYLYSILPVLRKLYKKEDELKAAMKNHVQFFNTTPHMGGFILGIDIATEAEGKNSSKDGVETANGIKTGLMGPFAGVGDTIFGVLIPTICGSIAAYMGQQGNVTGVVIWILVNIAIMAFRYLTVGIGYREGTKLIASAKDKLDALTSAATLLGITVVGALIPTVVRANITATFTTGEVTLAGQDILDQIMPSLVPVLIVAAIYVLLGKKKMTSTKAILIVMAASIIFAAIGFLG